jgi:hypothetical protein
VHDSIGYVIWEDRRGGDYRLYGCRWRRGRGPLDQPGFTLATASGNQHHPAVAAGEDGFGVVWVEPAGPEALRFQALDTGGLVSAPVTSLAGPVAGIGTPRIAYAAGRYLVVWDEDTGAGHRVLGRFVDQSGELLGSPFVMAAGGGDQFVPRVTGWESGFWVVWTTQDGSGRWLRRGRVDTCGVVHPLGGAPLTAPAVFAADAALTARDGIVLAAWRVPGAEDDDDLRAGWWSVDDTCGYPADTALVLVAAGTTDIPGPPDAPRALIVSANPFRDRVWISSPVWGEGFRVFDTQGRLQRRLPATSRVLWDGRDDQGAALPAGVYWIRSGSAGPSVRVVKLP